MSNTPQEGHTHSPLEKGAINRCGDKESPIQPSKNTSASPPQIQRHWSQNEPSETRAHKFLRKTERILLIALQVFGLAAAVIFGFWAPKSYALAQKAFDDQRIATNLSLTALVHQQYANQLAELSNRWSELSYILTIVQLRLSIMQLCKEYPAINAIACNKIDDWSYYFPSVIDTYGPNKSATPQSIQSTNITAPSPVFNPPGYPLPGNSGEHAAAPVALKRLSASIFGLAAIGTLVLSALILVTEC
ncbi:hypothetical protein CC80DRAFT_577322 [Byssothecium circinans]|uniref:Uncharacterized protein n=1 Tax=Byssothecium circinans TaxID=147558 RepID=A0A6A5U9V6_9PLEO|nr:hypothetical protein CC80DRAFT_577322 [Byssothecium circinans]